MAGRSKATPTTYGSPGFSGPPACLSRRSWKPAARPAASCWRIWATGLSSPCCDRPSAPRAGDATCSGKRLRWLCASPRTETPALARVGSTAGPGLDSERFRFEMDFFLEHYARGLRACADLPVDLGLELHALADRAADTPRKVFCHRDFHSRNLMVREGGELFMVDIQDSRWGPDTYDLASLLRDAYVEIDQAWIDPLVESYRTALGSPPPAGEFRARFDLVSAQRMLKALGTFGYQVTQRRASRFLEGIPRTLERLRALLPTVPGTGDLRRFLEESGLLSDT